MRIIFLTLSSLLLAPWPVLQGAEKPASAGKPNVVYIMADDLGWGDISAHGGGVPTPNIDRLFSKGVELTHFMGWCVCSPTRAMLLTGRHPIRVGTGPEVGGELDPEETTIAEGFKANGYRTGVFGKWHNGNDPETPAFAAHFAEAFKHMPNKKAGFGLGVNTHGFDEAWVYYGGGPDHFTRRTVKGGGPVSWWHNREFRPQDEGYTDDLLTKHALEFIRTSKEQPFFCYIPFQIAHAPLQAKESDLAKIAPQMAARIPAASEKVTSGEKHIHAAMLASLDQNVAAIEAALTELGLLENTIFVFTSDNGAMEAGNSLPLRGHKHTIYDGGVRLPTVVHWPKGGLAAGKKWNGLCGALDMFPTLMAMTESKIPETRPLDGKNIWPALRDNSASPVDSYYWIWRDSDALRTEKWKMHRYFDRFELYDINQDEAESANVSEANPDVVKTLAAKMDAWADSLGAGLGHRPAPAKYHQPAAPEGEVLAITVTITDKAKPRDRLAIPIANWSGTQYATDWIEYDVAFSSGETKRHPYYAPLEGNNNKPFGPLFRPGNAVDQHGRDQSTGPGIAESKSAWEHRIIGLAGSAPGPLGKHGVVFTGGKAGTYTIYLDNLRIRHVDGSTSMLWTGGKDTRTKKMVDTELFKNVQVRAINAAEVAKVPQERPLLLANYYCWYHDGQHPKRPFLHWTYPASETNPLAKKAQKPGEPPPNSVFRPLAGLYDSADPVVAEWHVRLAQAAGIDAFLVDWWDTHNDLDQNVDRGIVAAARKHGFKFALLDERAQFHQKFEDYQDMLARAMLRYKDHPSYLRIDGRPVVYLYQVASEPGLTVAEFPLLKKHVEAAAGPVYWIVDKIAHDAKAANSGDKDREKRIPADWLATPGVDCFAFYSTFSHFRAHDYADLVGKYRYMTQLAHDAGKKMLLPVHPGHDNSNFVNEPYLMPRRDGLTLRDFLRAATDAKADYIMVTSWNEWPESTVIEPSSTWPNPYLYLEIIAEWKGRTFTAPTLPEWNRR